MIIYFLHPCSDSYVFVVKISRSCECLLSFSYFFPQNDIKQSILVQFRKFPSRVSPFRHSKVIKTNKWQKFSFIESSVSQFCPSCTLIPNTSIKNIWKVSQVVSLSKLFFLCLYWNACMSVRLERAEDCNLKRIGFSIYQNHDTRTWNTLSLVWLVAVERLCWLIGLVEFLQDTLSSQ